MLKYLGQFLFCYFCYFSWKDTSLGYNVMKDPLELMLAVGKRRKISLCITLHT